jgi:hypothetical protein
MKGQKKCIKQTETKWQGVFAEMAAEVTAMEVKVAEQASLIAKLYKQLYKDKPQFPDFFLLHLKELPCQ